MIPVEAALRKSSVRAGARFGSAPVWVAVAVVGFLGLVLRLFRAGDVFSGFHSFNEGFYATQAHGYLQHGLWSALVSPGDYNNPPLFSVLVTIFFRAFGETTVVARLVPIISCLLLVVAVYGLARELYDERVGALAAVLVSFSPGLVLVGRNVQTDSLALLLIVGGSYFFVRACHRASLPAAVLAGLVFGLALNTKITAVLAIPCLIAWHVVDTGKITTAIDRLSLWFYGALLAAGSPWFVFQMVRHPDVFLGAQSHLAGTFSVPNWYFFSTGLFREALWMLSPVVLVLVAISLVVMCVRHQKRDFLNTSLLLVYSVFYFFYNYHTYYLVMITPFACIAVARLFQIGGFTTWRRIGAAGLVLGVTSAVFALLLMTAQKYGDDGIARLDSVLQKSAPGATVQALSVVTDNFGPALTFYSRHDIERLAPDATGATAAADPTAAVIGLTVGTQMLGRSVVYLPRTRTRLVLFGYALMPTPPQMHVFDLGAVRFERVGSPASFGVQEMAADPLFLVYLPTATAESP